MLLPFSAARAADQMDNPSNLVAKPDMSKKAEFDKACLDAIGFMAESYSSHTPPSGRAMANVKMCNGHPLMTMCEISSQAMLREYGKTPFTCGTDTADSVPLFFPEDYAAVARHSQ